MEIDDLARATQEQFGSMQEHMDSMQEHMDKGFTAVDQRLSRLEDGVKQILAIVVGTPDRKFVEKLSDKVENIDDRLLVVEHKVLTR